ncbi:hypothetical protein ACO0QE_001018 [Hanseniaspora vineae]
MAAFDLEFEPNPFEQSFASKSPASIQTKSTPSNGDKSSMSSNAAVGGSSVPVVNRSASTSVASVNNVHNGNSTTTTTTAITNNANTKMSSNSEMMHSGPQKFKNYETQSSANTSSNAKDRNGIGKIALPLNGAQMKPPVIVSPAILTPGGSRHLPMPTMQGSHNSNGQNPNHGHSNNHSHNNNHNHTTNGPNNNSKNNSFHHSIMHPHNNSIPFANTDPMASNNNNNAIHNFTLQTSNGSLTPSGFFLNFSSLNSGSTSTKNGLANASFDPSIRTGLTPAILYPQGNQIQHQPHVQGFNSQILSSSQNIHQVKPSNTESTPDGNSFPSIHNQNNTSIKPIFSGLLSGTDSPGSTFFNQTPGGRLQPMLGLPLNTFSPGHLSMLGTGGGNSTPGILNGVPPMQTSNDNITADIHKDITQVNKSKPKRAYTKSKANKKDVSEKKSKGITEDKNDPNSSDEPAKKKRKKSVERIEKQTGLPIQGGETGDKKTTETTKKSRKKLPPTLKKEPQNSAVTSEPLLDNIQDWKTGSGAKDEFPGSEENLTAEEKLQKRKEFLERNRVAASKFRKRKKEYVSRMEKKVAFYKSEYKDLTENCLSLFSGVGPVKTSPSSSILKGGLLKQLKTSLSTGNYEAAMSLVNQIQDLVNNTAFVKRGGIDTMQMEDDQEEKTKKDFDVDG